MKEIYPFQQIALLLLFLLFVSFQNTTHAQTGYIECATFLNGNGDQYPYNNYSKVVNGVTYIVMADNGDSGTGPHLPVINGTAYPSGTNNDRYYIAMLDANCNQTFGTYLGGSHVSGIDRISDLEIDTNGNLVFAGYSSTNDFPTTDGTTHSGSYDFVVAKYAPNGTLIFSTMIGSSVANDNNLNDLYIDATNGDIYLLGRLDATAIDFPTTDGTSVSGSSSTTEVVMKYDSNGNLMYSTIVDANNFDGGLKSITAQGGALYLIGNSSSSDYPTTDGTTNTGASEMTLAKIDPMGTVNFRTMYGGNGGEIPFRILSDATGVYLMGETSSSNFVTTDGTSISPSGGYALFIQKFDLNGNLIYSTILGNTDPQDFQLLNGEVFLIGETNVDNYPVVNGVPYNGSVDHTLTKLDASGAIVYSTYFGTINYEDNAVWYVNSAGEVYLTDDMTDSPNTDGTSGSGVTFAKFNADGSLCVATTISGYGLTTEANESPFSSIEVVGNTITMTGSSKAGISTDGTASSGLGVNGFYADMFVLKYNLCAPSPTVTSDPLTPVSQTVCQNGLVAQIFGDAIETDGSTFPPIYTDGVLGQQPNAAFNYQWELATSPTGPWTAIDNPLAQLQNYSPPPTTQDVYYRRITSQPECCGGAVISTSDVASVLVSGDAAPTADAGGSFYSCAGNPLTLGGSPSASGGTAPYTYTWTNGATAVANPSVSPTESSIYTLVVIDDNGCEQSDQAGVTIYAANAGTDQEICPGESVTIGGTPLIGVTVVPFGSPSLGQYSIAYTWTPDNGTLSCTDCPQPTATITGEETYTLTVTIYQPDGSACSTSDMVTVDVSPVISDANFAGDDQLICLGETLTLGSPTEVLNDYTFANIAQASVDGATATLANLVDGDFGTGGKTQTGTGNNEIIIDLGSVQEFNEIQLAGLTGYYSYANSFHIDISSDNVSYARLQSSISRPSVTALQTYNFPITQARYIRLIGRLSSRYVAISEVRVRRAFQYIWTPGDYIIPDGGEALFDAGNLDMPFPNPITYTATANLGLCNSYDQVQVAIIEARAGIDGCGPRVVGEEDRTPNINETYLWEKITDPILTTGTGDFTGPTNTVTTSVSESIGGQVAYQLTTTFTFGGITKACIDTVIVPPCGCVVDIEVEGFGCASYDPDNPVTLVATAGDIYSDNPDDFTYSWTPTEGLDTYTGRYVQLTDAVERTYTVTMSSPYDPSFMCTQTIDVNLPVFSTPTFNVTSPVATCAEVGVNIGDPANNPGLAYAWNPAAALDDDTISYPIATVSETTEFYVIVTDKATGCATVDTVLVEVGQVANAGPDRIICDNATITLGQNNELSGYTYSWSPAAADWRNGTDENDAKPDVFISGTGTTTFVLTLTETARSCVTTDTMEVTVEPIPPTLTLPDISFCPSQADDIILGTDDGTASGTNLVPTGYAYGWSPSGLLNYDADSANPTIPSWALPQEQITFRLSLISASGGCNAISEQTIVPASAPPMTTDVSDICLGESLNLGSSSNPTSGITYAWSPSTGLDDDTSPNPLFTPTSGGNFTFTVTKTDNNFIPACETSAEITINVQEITTPIVAPITICQGSTVTIGLTSSNPAYAYSWTPTTGLDDPNIHNPTFSGTSSTNYTLSMVNSLGCTAEIPVSVVVSTDPAPTITLPNQQVCLTSNSTVVLDASVSPAATYSYQWSPSSNLSNDQIEDPTLYIPQSGTYNYTLTVINQSNGCQSSADVEIVAGAPTGNCIASSNSPVTTCGTLSLMGTDGVSFSWTGPNGFTSTLQNPEIANPPTANSGTYTLTVTDEFGCEVTCSVAIVITNGLPVATASATQPSCIDGVIPDDGTLQLNSVTNGAFYHYSIGGTFDDDGGAKTYANATSLAGATYPLELATGISNPSSAQDYTIRIYSMEGENCFTDIVVTMNRTTGCCPPNVKCGRVTVVRN